jgi:alpha-methylacyl-CoA racemase
MKEAFARVFKTRTRDEWVAAFEGTETCFSPVLSLAEAPLHPHQVARGNFVEVAGVVQPAPAPRFSRSKGAIQRQPPEVGEHSDEVLHEWGFASDEIASLREAGAI